MKVRCRCNKLVELGLWVGKYKFLPENLIDQMYVGECDNCKRRIDLVVWNKLESPQMEKKK